MSWTQPLASCQVSEVKGEVGVNCCQHPVILYLFIEDRTGTDLIENVPVDSHWLGDRRTSYGAGLLVSKFTSARSLELQPFSDLFGLAEFWDKVLNMLHTHFGVSGGQFTLKAHHQSTALPAVQPLICLRDPEAGKPGNVGSSHVV